MPIKFNFTKSDGVSLNKGEIQASGLNSHVLVPKGSTIDFKSLLIENLTPDITIIKDFEERVTDIHDVISDMKDWMEDPTQLTAIINTAIDGSTYSSVVEEVSTYTDSTKSAAWYGLSMVTGANNQKWVTGYEIGSVTTNTGDNGTVNDNFFYVHSDNFIIGKALNIMDAETTTDASRTITYDLFDNSNNVIGTRTLNVPYATLWDTGRYEDDYLVQQDNAVLYPLPALMVQWDKIAKNYYIGFNGRVEFNSIYHNGTTIIEGGSITTQTIKAGLINADQVVIGASTSARHFGNFPQYFDVNKVKLSSQSGAMYQIYNPSGSFGNISWMEVYYPNATLREGDTYFDVPKGSNYVYNGTGWISTTGTTTYVQYIFKAFARGASPSKPTGGSFVSSTFSPPIDWLIDAIAPNYDSGNQLYSSFNTVTISKTTENGIIVPKYTLGDSWSLPVAFNTEAPIYGTDFQDGINGPYTSYVYKDVNRGTDAPDTPTGGNYTGSPSTEITPTTDDGINWDDNPSYDSTKDCYVSYAVYIHTAGETTNSGSWDNSGWSVPALYNRIPTKGHDYSDAAGNFHATVYRVVNKATATDWASLLPPSTAKYTVSGGVTDLGYDGWADEPTTVDLATQFLVMSTGMFTQPTISGVASPTASWGLLGSWSAPIKTTIEKGVDYFDGSTGDFISFVYQNSASQPATPDSFTEIDPNGSFDGINETPPTSPSAWSDNPPPNPANTVWVSKRRYKAPANNGLGSWAVSKDWSEPSIYYQKGVDGADVNFWFKRSTSVLTEAPYGGTTPGTDWYDEVGDITAGTAGKLYATKGTKVYGSTMFTFSVPYLIEGELVRELTIYANSLVEKPSSSTYDFSTNVLTIADTSWASSMSAISSNNDVRYKATAVVAGNSTQTAVSITWSDPVLYAQRVDGVGTNGARGAIPADIDILGDSDNIDALYFTHYRYTGSSDWVSLDSAHDCMFSRSEIFALVIPKDGLYYRKGDTVVCQQYKRSISSDGTTCSDGTYPRKSATYALTSPSASFSMVIPADATALTDLLTNVKLWVHGDAIIDNTLSVKKLIVGDGTSNNEVVISGGKLTAKNIVADSINLTNATVTGTLSANYILSGSISETFLISFTSENTNLYGYFPKGTDDNTSYPYSNTIFSYYYNNGVIQNSFTAPQYHTKATIMATISSFGVSTGDESLTFTVYIVDVNTANSIEIGNRIRTGSTVLGDIIFLNSVDITAGHLYIFKVKYDYGNWNKWEEQWFSVNILTTTYR